MTVQLWEEPPEVRAPAVPERLDISSEGDTETTRICAWDAPAWAQGSRVEDMYVLHWRVVGEMRPAQDDVIRISVSQMDNLGFAPGSTSVNREPAYIVISGHCLTPSEVRELRRLVDRALALVT